MATLDSLPPDQRAVLQLVLQRGRTYDQIADLLAIDRAAVRQRALDGFDALGPSSSISDHERSLVTDYLLGQLPPKIADHVRELLATSPATRAWARVVAAEIGPLSGRELPEIPAAASAAVAAAPEVEPFEDEPEELLDEEPEPDAAQAVAAASTLVDRDPAQTRPGGPQRPPAGDRPPSSRRGGGLLLGALAAIVIVVVVVIIATSGGSGGSKSANSRTGLPATGSTTTATSGSGTSTTGTSTVQKLGQINLTPPDGKSKALGVAELAQSGSTTGIVIVAQGLPANNHNAYGVWLYTGPGQQHFLGFYDAKVGSSGRMEVQTALPANYKSYKQILVTLETGTPSHPGTIVLQGSV